VITRLTQFIGRRYKKFIKKIGFPIPIDQIQDALRSVGIQQGDSLLIHSSLRSFYHGAARSNARYKTGEDYARDIIKMFLDITGDTGILMMPTEFVRGYQRASAVNEAYSLSNAPSKRGYMTDFFLKWDGVIRSTHPIYNVAVYGKGFDDVLQNHWDLLYTMDVGSPWHKFMELGGKVVFFGVPIDNNSIIHMPEYILKNDYPRPVFYNKPHVFN
jgi:aminoglycoside 3-N-acetyltransferase